MITLELVKAIGSARWNVKQATCFLPQSPEQAEFWANKGIEELTQILTELGYK